LAAGAVAGTLAGGIGGVVRAGRMLSAVGGESPAQNQNNGGREMLNLGDTPARPMAG